MKKLKSHPIETQIGPMLTISDDEQLYMLEYLDRHAIAQEIKNIEASFQSEIEPAETPISKLIFTELQSYFQGKLKAFQTPITMTGTPFQQQVWRELIKIPYGETISYGTLANRIGMPTGFRAVATANGCNQLAIIIPCHRVINSNGGLGGYSGGLDRKNKLLNLERFGGF